MIDAPEGSFQAVVADFHSCGLRTDGTITCWGATDVFGNDMGEIDPPEGSFRAISAGLAHSCGLRTDDAIACWGWNSTGQIDAPGGPFQAVTAGLDHSCGLRLDNRVVCWGSNIDGAISVPFDGPVGPVVDPAVISPTYVPHMTAQRHPT